MKVADHGKNHRAAAAAHEGDPRAEARPATPLADALAASPRSVAQRAWIAAAFPGHGSPLRSPVQRMFSVGHGGGGGMGGRGGGGGRRLPDSFFHKETESTKHENIANKAVGEVEDDAESAAELQQRQTELQQELRRLENKLEEYQSEKEQAEQELEILREREPPNPEDVRYDAHVEFEQQFPGEFIDDQTMDDEHEDLDLPDVQQAEADYEEYHEEVENLEDRISVLESKIEETEAQLDAVQDELAEVGEQLGEIEQRRGAGPGTRTRGKV